MSGTKRAVTLRARKNVAKSRVHHSTIAVEAFQGQDAPLRVEARSCFVGIERAAVPAVLVFALHTNASAAVRAGPVLSTHAIALSAARDDCGCNIGFRWQGHWRRRREWRRCVLLLSPHESLVVAIRCAETPPAISIVIVFVRGLDNCKWHTPFRDCRWTV